MPLENIYYVAQTIGVVFVFLSLLFVGVQIRQNTEQARLNTEQARQQEMVARAELTMNSWNYCQSVQESFYRTEADTSFMNKALLSNGQLTRTENTRFGIRMATLLSAVEAMFVLQENDLMEAAAFDRSIHVLGYYLKSKRVKKMWAKVRIGYYSSTGFGTMIDNAIAQINENDRLPLQDNLAFHRRPIDPSKLQQTPTS